jgi:hypothetical protein
MKVVPAELHFLYKCHKGWTEGISFKEGGSGTLLIPSHLGYGSNDSKDYRWLRACFCCSSKIKKEPNAHKSLLCCIREAV